MNLTSNQTITPCPPSINLNGGEREVAFLIYPGFQIQDLSGPLSAFEVAGAIDGACLYSHHVVSLSGGVIRSSSGLEVMTTKIRAKPYDTLIVVGGLMLVQPCSLSLVVDQLNKAATQGGRRIASVCTGAFLLGEAGLLDGRRATTHWKYAAHLQRQFPKVKVEGDRIFIKDGVIWTSAGVTSGIDLALAMIEEDQGREIAHATSQMLVVYHRRPGNQSQFSTMSALEPESDRIRQVLIYMREHLTLELSTEHLASVACLSPRQFGRAFLSETGETPAKAVERLRVEVARLKVERSVVPIEIIARNTGFVDPERMRRAFIRVTGHPPQSIRRMAEDVID